MLYGHKEIVDNRIASIIGSADSTSEYDDWVTKVHVQEKDKNYEELFVSKLMDHMLRDEIRGYRRPVLIVYHTDETQRAKFFDEWQIKDVKSQAGRDRQFDMIHNQKQDARILQRDAEFEAAKAENREPVVASIEEMHGLVENDPWDHRTDEQKAEDADFKKQMKDLQRKGDISSDSFAGAAEQRADKNTKKGKAPKPSSGTTKVTDIRTIVNEDGTIEIDNALAQKWGGDVDTALSKQRIAEHEAAVEEKKKGKRVFSPEDFAAVLRGDGSSDHIDIPADIDPETKRRVDGSKLRPSLSQAAEAARKQYQAEKEELAKEAAKKKRLEQDQLAQEEREQGIFRGCDLIPDQMIAMADLPEVLRKLFEEAKIKEEYLPFKDYPYNSMLGDMALLPHDSLSDATSLKIGALENLEVEGLVALGNPGVLVVSRKDNTLSGWAVYAKQKQNISTEEENNYNISLVRIR